MEVQLAPVSTHDYCLPTKRRVLSILAAIFDPLGIIGQVSIPVKLVFQEICTRKIGWDESLPHDIAQNWLTWLNAFQQTSEIEFPRCYYEGIEGDVLNFSLHGFGDASRRHILLFCI